MSILISPTKSKGSGNSNFNSQNNGYSSENGNNPSSIYKNNKIKNESDDECKTMLSPTNNRFKIDTSNCEGKNIDKV